MHWFLEPRRHYDHLTLESINVAGVEIRFSLVPIRNLGVLFDSSLCMDDHVRSVVRSASYQLRNIGIVRKLLTEDATKSLCQAVVLSRIDYCNSTLAGLNESSLDKLQLVQNRAARLVPRCDNTLRQSLRDCIGCLSVSGSNIKC